MVTRLLSDINGRFQKTVAFGSLACLLRKMILVNLLCHLRLEKP